ncbi:MAG TPA: S8 family serine peptidase [Planktothrix sp.]|jgi:hypothetical protein
MDIARIETGVDKAIEEFKLSGRGVLVATIDRGIDWRNDDFRHEDGSTRIEWMFDLTDDRGKKDPLNQFSVGTIYHKNSINRALCDGSRLNIRDAVGHGTTTAAIACGSGRNNPDRKYRGIAPEASLIVVKICSDGAPRHDQEPAERKFFKYERIAFAIDFIRDRARELNMPCVMVLNIGTQGGATDATSWLCKQIDATVGPETSGLVFVTGPGDEGTDRKHRRTTILNGKQVPVGTIWDAASAHYNICPGDYVIRTEWTDVDGVPRANLGEGGVGDIWTGSSVGPTADGRIGIDICAPGDSVFTTYNPKSDWATYRYNLIHDGSELYGRASAVSAANPMTAGIIALMLQRNPLLNGPKTKSILQMTARKDTFTGDVPNVFWGFGKIDAYAAIKMCSD